MPLNLSDLSLLDAIARHGSFAAAARDLGKVPSALTYTVRKLEDEIDVLLFDRRGQRAVLTPAGECLLSEGRRLMADAQALVQRTRLIGSGWEIRLSIGVDALISFDALAPLLAEFDQLGAPTRVRLSYEVLHGTWQALTDQRADLIIGASGAQPPDAFAEQGSAQILDSAPLGEVSFIFCVAPEHPLVKCFKGTPLNAEALRDFRAVVLADTVSGLAGQSAGPGNGPVIGVVQGQDCIAVATLEQKIKAQIAGLGIGFLPEPFARPLLASGALRTLPVAFHREPARLFYAWRAGPPGKALAWWLSKLKTPRVRQRLLGGPGE